MSKSHTNTKKLMNKASEQARKRAFGAYSRWSKSDDIGLDGIGMTAPRRHDMGRCDPPAIKVKERPVYSTRIIETHW